MTRRSLLTIVIVLCAAVVAATAAIRLILPTALGGLDDLGPGVAGRLLGEPVHAAAALAAGLVALGVAILDARHQAPRAAGPAAAVAAVALLLVAPGDLIPVAGYAFAMAVVIGVVVLAGLFTRRHPWWGLLILATLTALVIWTIARMRAATLAGELAEALGAVLPAALVAAAYPAAAAALVVRALPDLQAGRFPGWVLRHRTAITVIAACCALPYSIARASWLTPWPLFAPAGVTADPMVLLTGLGLGAAMATGGLLTLGLVRPWGRRFPRWMGGLAGRSVPVALAVVPASVVSALFTIGGIDLVMSALAGDLGDGSWPQVLEMTLVFPFWLWGPLLALASWGYAMAARREAQAPAVTQRPDRTRQPSVPSRASR